MLIPTDKKLVGKAKRLARKTGVQHDVIHASGRTKQYITVAPRGANGRHGRHDDFGVVTVLWTPSDGKK